MRNFASQRSAARAYARGRSQIARILAERRQSAQNDQPATTTQTEKENAPQTQARPGTTQNQNANTNQKDA